MQHIVTINIINIINIPHWPLIYPFGFVKVQSLPSFPEKKKQKLWLVFTQFRCLKGLKSISPLRQRTEDLRHGKFQPPTVLRISSNVTPWINKYSSTAIPLEYHNISTGQVVRQRLRYQTPCHFFWNVTNPTRCQVRWVVSIWEYNLYNILVFKSHPNCIQNRHGTPVP